MTIAEKVAHLKGLMEGLNCDDKILTAIADILEDLAYDVEDVQDALAEVGEQVELIDEDLYEVECPACGEVICIDGCIVDEGEMDCPNCGEHLEFEMDEEEEDEE